MSGADLVRRCVDAINRGDAAAYAAEFTADAVIHDPSYPHPLKGREAIQADIAVLLRAVPDIRGTIRSVVSDGDQVAAEVTFQGTNTEPYVTPQGEVPPTGRPVSLHLHDHVELGPDGQAAEERRYYDTAAFYTQFGVTA